MDVKTVLLLGADGYIGTPMTLRLLEQGYRVLGVDDFQRREHVMEMESFSAIEIQPPGERYEIFRSIGDFQFKNLSIDINYNELVDFIKPYEIDTIVNLAQQPSAPFSMKSRDHAIDTLENNNNGTLNILYLMKEHCPNAHLVQIGTMGEYGCFSDDTEIFTSKGWKLFKDLAKTDEVATRTKEDRTLIFKKPNSIHEYGFTDDKMYYQKMGRLDILVTPNHRMFTQKRTAGEYKELRLEYIPDILNKARIYDVGFEWNGVDQKYFELPAVDKVINGPQDYSEKKIPMNVWVDFLGWYLSEGNVRYKNDKTYGTIIVQNEDNIESPLRPVSLLCDMFNWNSNVYSDTNSECRRITIYGKQLATYLQRFGKAGDKYIPQEIKNLDKKYLKILLNSLVDGDGSAHREERSWRYYSISKQLADDVQEIALKCGYSANVSFSDKKNIWTVNICITPRVHVNHDKPTDGFVEYKGKVYCVNVGGDGIVFVRRNGNPVWCGNTPDVDIPEGIFDLEFRGRVAKDVLFPRCPASWYHATKVHSTYLIDAAYRWWNINATDIMQGVLYGNWTPEIEKYNCPTRLDSDESFGTAINRFTVQALIGAPMTAFGDGLQKRGYLSLNDSIQCLMLAIENPAIGYRTWNQLDIVYSIMELTKIVGDVCKKHGIETETVNIHDTRIERTDDHYYMPDGNKLRALGFNPTRTVAEDVDYIVRTLKNKRDELYPLREVVMPNIWWDERRKIKCL